MSVEFEPVKLGRRGRRLDPVALGAIVVVVAIVLAVLKPWAGGAGESIGDAPTGPAEAVPVSSSDLTGPHSTASLTPAKTVRADATTSPIWSDVAAVVRRHEAWGIRAIVVAGPADGDGVVTQRFAERWFAVTLDGDRQPIVEVDADNRSIVALGVTFPPATTPLDARVWRMGAGGLAWIDTEPLDAAPSGGAFTYVRPGPIGRPIQPWTAGTYRMDILVAGTVRRLSFAIPDRFSNVPDPGRPSLRDQAPLPDPASVPASDLPVGLFAAVDGVAVPIGGDEGPPLDEAGAWLDLDPGTRRAPRSFVAAAYLPRANGLGVALPARSVVITADLARLAPAPLAEEATRVDAGASAGSPSSVALFQAPAGEAWTPGVYAISIVWADFEGLHREAWHVELRPGPIRQPGSLLAAAREWARYAGASGMILGTNEPAPSGVGCGSSMIGSPGILGFAYAADHDVATAKARILLPFLHRDDQVVMTARLGIRGLIILAPARIATLPSGVYQFTLGDGPGDEVFNLCFGMAVFDD